MRKLPKERMKKYERIYDGRIALDLYWHRNCPMCRTSPADWRKENLSLCRFYGEYHRILWKMGCVLAAEPDRKLVEEDPRDIQLEYTLGG